ncbi:diaminopimelate epimerase [Dongia sedimenti]|uniref:Diaminopimelate epimerase n=1 Tax=Dongia sedimenti TaxID=3064282 RepID=A0ABU0YTF2_9PROT|nr:diaminopimelate epimerase [Rhodospirillaceae bacterium R-7]
MGLKFARMHGCGNDFVVIDDRTGAWHARREALAREICDRRRGLGGDGLILIQPGRDGADFRMTYVNRTGMDGEMCGNGARCTVLRAAQLGLIRSAGLMATDAGPIRAAIDGSAITLQMTPPMDERPPLRLDIAGQPFDCYTIDTGVPHVVIFLDEEAALEALDVDGVGRILRHHAAFAPRGVNANFAARRGDGSFRMRTYERGVEMETLACGTGAVAVGLMAHRRFGSDAPVLIHPTGGGLLRIGFRVSAEGFSDVTLAGPAELIAEGDIADGWLANHGLISASAS